VVTWQYADARSSFDMETHYRQYRQGSLFKPSFACREKFHFPTPTPLLRLVQTTPHCYYTLRLCCTRWTIVYCQTWDCEDHRVYHEAFMPLFLHMNELRCPKNIDKPLAFRLSSPSQQQAQETDPPATASHDKYPQLLHQDQLLHPPSNPFTKQLHKNNIPTMPSCPDKRKGNCRPWVKLFGVFHCPKHQTVCGMHTYGWAHLKRQSCCKCDRTASRAESSPATEQSS
jgi:hypothetical protein